MSLDEIKDLLDRYLAGTCTGQEKSYVEEWLLKNGRDNEEWIKMPGMKREQWLSDLYTDIGLSIISKDSASKPRQHKILTINRGWKTAVSVAASIVMLIGIYFLWPALKQSGFKEYRVAAGARKVLTLQDGSRVWLNSATYFKCPGLFNKQTRDVYLEGEAYFEVAPDVEKPFIVHTGKLSTKVLGTHFNIRAYNSDPEISVALLEGKVQLVSHTENQTNLILRPSELGIYRKEASELKKITVNSIADYSAWKDGKLIFDEAPVQDVINRLSVIFNAKVDLNNTDMKRCTVTGTFNYNQGVDEILSIICISLDGKFRKDAGRYIISGEGCNN